MDIDQKIETIIEKKEIMDGIFKAIVRSHSFSSLINDVNSQSELPEFIFSGVGKNWYICEKVVKTFLSMGIKARALDCVHALHGDLGMLTGKNQKILFFLSRSGTTAEVVRLAKIVKKFKDDGILENLQTVGFSLNMNLPNSDLYDKILVPDDICVLSQIFEFDERCLVPSMSIDIMQLVLDLMGVLIYESHQNLVDRYVYNHLSGANGSKLGSENIVGELLK